MFVGEAGAYPSEAHFSRFTLGYASGLAHTLTYYEHS
jgi:hypothetical protein